MIQFFWKTTWIAAATIIVALGLLLAAPKLVGGQSYSVLSGSMAPVVDTGDMVAVVPLKAEDIRVGQIVAFNDPDGGDKLFQHRVRSVERTGINNTTVSVVTKGDANSSSESWSVSEDDQVGRVVLIVPKVGYVVGWVTGGTAVTLAGKSVPLGMAIILGLLVVFALIILVQIFREPEEEEEDDVEVLIGGETRV